MQGVQGRAAGCVKEVVGHRTELVQIPFALGDIGVMPTNSAMRSRGFTFLLLGAACACMNGSGELHVYENGIGAVNLPYRKCQVGVDHTRSVHPISLIQMGVLVSTMLGTPFSFRLPFLFHTKAQLCDVMADRRWHELVGLTISCDSRHRSHCTQCGYCSSCLLRRQALSVNGIPDTTGYLVTSTSADSQSVREGREHHLAAMLHRVHLLRSLLSSEDPWTSLVFRFRELQELTDRAADYLGDSPEAVKAKLLSMYGRYVQEWDCARSMIAPGSLRIEQSSVGFVPQRLRGDRSWKQMPLIPSTLAS